MTINEPVCAKKVAKIDTSGLNRKAATLTVTRSDMGLNGITSPQKSTKAYKSGAKKPTELTIDSISSKVSSNRLCTK